MSGSEPLYISFERVEYRRDAQTLIRYKALHGEPGLAHALDVKNTREGDPWGRRFGRPARGGVRQPVFYDNDGPRAACGRSVLVVLPSAYDPEDTDSCPECGKLVESGAAWGRYMQPVPFHSCDSVVQIEQEAHACHLRHGHSGPHRNGGATWETGPDDFVPAPDGYV